MDCIRKYADLMFLALVALLTIIIWSIVLAFSPKNTLSVSFLDVGQGDSILIESPVGNRVLIDGGGSAVVLARLSPLLPYFRRNIDVVIETHPDKDHIGGLVDVLQRIRVGSFIEPGVKSENSIDDALLALVKQKNIPHTLARAPQSIDLGGGATIDILFPNRDVSEFETNAASVIARLNFGNTCFLFTGDLPQHMEEYLVLIYGKSLKCDVLKAGHHGSRTSSGKIFLSVVHPSYVVISAGKGNSYGHPHVETLERIQAIGAKIFSTAESGTIQMISDGKSIKVQE